MTKKITKKTCGASNVQDCVRSNNSYTTMENITDILMTLYKYALYNELTKVTQYI